MVFFFQSFKTYKDCQGNRPLKTIDWARTHDKNLDVFLFLGTAGMNFKHIKTTKKKYEAFLNSKIKYVFI